MDSLSPIPDYQRLPDLSFVSEYRSRYAAEIFHAERWVGELLDAVDARHSERDPIVLLTADHGENFGETHHYFSRTHSSAPNVANVPMILRAPGIYPERRSEIVHHVDVMPTLLELAGLPVPPGASGVALGPVVQGSEALPDRYVYCDNGNQVSAYRGNEFIRITSAAMPWLGAHVKRHRSVVGPLRGTTYSWTSGSIWNVSRNSDAAEPLPDEVSSYLNSTVSMAKRGVLSELEIEQMKALGYVETD